MTAHTTDAGAELQVQAASAYLKLVRDFVRDAAVRQGCTPQVAGDLVSAVDEACQNVIRYAYGTDPGGPLTVRVARDDDRLLIRIIDEAPAVDPGVIEPQPLDISRPGGLGTHVMHAAADEITLPPGAAGSGNPLCLTRRIA